MDPSNWFFNIFLHFHLICTVVRGLSIWEQQHLHAVSSAFVAFCCCSAVDFIITWCAPMIVSWINVWWPMFMFMFMFTSMCVLMTSTIFSDFMQISLMNDSCAYARVKSCQTGTNCRHSMTAQLQCKCSAFLNSRQIDWHFSV